MQQRAAIDGLDAEADSRHRLGAQPNLRLRPERTARLQLDRARTAARFAAAAARGARSSRIVCSVGRCSNSTRRSDAAGARLRRSLDRCQRSDRAADCAQARTSPSRCGQLRHDCRRAARPALQLRRRLLQNAARGRFRNAGGPLQLERNQRIRIDRRRACDRRRGPSPTAHRSACPRWWR